MLGPNIEPAAYKKCPWCQFPASRPPQYSVFQIGLNLHDNRGVLDPSRYFCSITEPARHWDYLANCRNLSFHVANRSQRLNWYLLPSNTLNSGQSVLVLMSPWPRKTGDLAETTVWLLGEWFGSLIVLPRSLMMNNRTETFLWFVIQNQRNHKTTYK